MRAKKARKVQANEQATADVLDVEERGHAPHGRPSGKKNRALAKSRKQERQKTQKKKAVKKD